MKLKKPYTIQAISQQLNARFNGDPKIAITGINEIHKVVPGDLTFVDYHKYYDRALQSPASVILIDKEIAHSNGKGLIISDDPFRDYNLLVEKFQPFKPCYQSISKTATICNDTTIQPNVFIGNHVVIGNNCIIHANVSICDYTIIGDNVTISANTAVGADAFYFKTRQHNGNAHYEKMLSCGRVVIQNDVEIGAGCTIDRGVSGDTIIGQGTKIDNHVHVGHGTIVGKNCLFAAQVAIAGQVIIEDNVILWGQVGVSKDLRIGAKAVVLAQSGVGKSLEAGKVYFGSPVVEARDKWKEIALTRKLPEMWETIKEMVREVV